MTIAYLSLGSNIGDKQKNLQEALKRLNELEGINIEGTSSIYLTDPVDYLDQPEFLNMVIKIDTILPPQDLLSRILAIEESMQRVRVVRFGPRNIDIDILLYGEKIVQIPSLIIPHPRMTQRGFVLIPLLEVAGNISIPKVVEDLSILINRLPSDQWVEIMENNDKKE